MDPSPITFAAFEVRDDERPFFRPYQEKDGVNLSLISEPLMPQTLEFARGCLGVSILGRSRLDRPMLEALKQQGVKHLASRTAGLNHIDLEAAAELGFIVTHASYSPCSVADFTIMLMLTCLRKYKQALFRANVNDYSLSGLQGREMRSLTVGIVGTGNIGCAVMRNLSGFGCRILACSRHRPSILPPNVEYTDFEELICQSDIISLHLPLTEETQRLINRETLARMKDGVILINTARGGLLDVDALIEGIESEKIGALGVDVFEHEEDIFHKDRRSDIISNRDMAYIRQFPNTVMTQHMAFFTQEAVASMVQCSMDHLLHSPAVTL